MIKFHTDFLFQYTVERSYLILVEPPEEKALKSPHNISSVADANIHFAEDTAKEPTPNFKVLWFLIIRNYIYIHNVDEVVVTKMSPLRTIKEQIKLW